MKRKLVEYYLDVSNRWRWRALASNGNVVADSGEGYSRKVSAKKGARRAMLSLFSELGGDLPAARR